MAIDTSGYVTVVEAADQLSLSLEQVRRKLRDGSLQGHRVGNQWFVEASQLKDDGTEKQPLIPKETMERIRRLRRLANEQRIRLKGEPFDPMEMLKLSRERR